jgi:hypothetical protein
VSGGSTQVDQGQYKIKVVIIIILKLDSGVNPGQGPDHGFGGSTWVDSGQCKDKNYYYHSFKI